MRAPKLTGLPSDHARDPMNQVAIAGDADQPHTPAEAAPRAAAEPRAFAGVEDAWRRNFETGAQAVRALQAHNADFAGQLLELNLQAAQAFGAAAAGDASGVKPYEIGVSAVELCFGYLGRSAALAQQAIMLPWADRKACS